MLEPQTATARLGRCRESFINNFGRSFTGHGSFSHFFLPLSLLHTHAHSLSLTLFLTHSDKLFLLLKHTLTLTHSRSNILSHSLSLFYLFISFALDIIFRPNSSN